MMRSIFWFRHDLRLEDNPGFAAAAVRGDVIPVFVLDTTDRRRGGASRWWLHHSLADLTQRLGGLVIRQGDPRSLLPDLARKSGASAVFWNRCYEPHAVARDKTIKTELRAAGIQASSFAGNVVYEPWEIMNKSGGPYKVYSPYWKAVRALGFPPPQATPDFNIAECGPYDEGVDSLRLLPRGPDWAAEWERCWQPGETGAKARTEAFMHSGISGYGTLRDRPDLDHVSRLSPHLHFGEISPRKLCSIASYHEAQNPSLSGDIAKFKSEIVWREFARHLLFHFPEIPGKNWKPAFDSYPWRDAPDDLHAWQRGMTGYPMVDAGMRELWQTGYMHNRVRMLAASFLVKHLRIHWQHGEAWFWDTLVDADLANNVAGWQWVTGSGADAAPYFRIFNPTSQGSKFDPNGDYVRRWCPELSALPNSVLHAPFEADRQTLSQAGIILGKTYPHPIVNHADARQAALAGYELVKPSKEIP